jgi:hypothetical protein
VRNDAYEYLLESVGRPLLAVTKGCRPDMHDPDEQEVSAKVVGNHLDNAMGNSVVVGDRYQEFVVRLKRDRGTFVDLNLASLLALARVGAEQLELRPNDID